MAFDEPPPESEITAMDISLDSMVETYTDIKELIDTAMDNFRRSNLTIIHGGKDAEKLWHIIQISISGLNIWRRAFISHECTIEELHRLIQIGMDWKNTYRHRFYYENTSSGKHYLHEKIKIDTIDFRGKKELIYEYGTQWIIKVMIMSSYQPAKNEAVRFVAGEGAAPPETIGGSRHFVRLLAALESGSNAERQAAIGELGADFMPGWFDPEKCNRNLCAPIQES
jgi:hypothetical protein